MARSSDTHNYMVKNLFKYLLMFSLPVVPLANASSTVEIPHEVIPDRVTVYTGADRVDIRKLTIGNPEITPVTVHAVFDTSWIMVHPARFTLGAGEVRNVEVFFILERAAGKEHTTKIFFNDDTGKPGRSVDVEVIDLAGNRGAQLYAANQAQSTGFNPNTVHPIAGQLYVEAMQVLRGEIADNWLTVHAQGAQFIIRMSGASVYDPGATIPKIAVIKSLKKIGRLLGQRLPSGSTVQIGAHTDNYQVDGEPSKSNSLNWEISAKRASVVAHFLQYNCGVDGHAISATGYSFFRPVANPYKPETNPENRRLEIVVTINWRN